jgi:hypothetical protein
VAPLSVAVVAEKRPGYDGEPYIGEARTVAVAMLEAEIDHAANVPVVEKVAIGRDVSPRMFSRVRVPSDSSDKAHGLIDDALIAMTRLGVFLAMRGNYDARFAEVNSN